MACDDIVVKSSALSHVCGVCIRAPGGGGPPHTFPLRHGARESGGFRPRGIHRGRVGKRYNWAFGYRTDRRRNHVEKRFIYYFPWAHKGFIELMDMMQSRRTVIWQGRIEMLSKAVADPPFMKEF